MKKNLFLSLCLALVAVGCSSETEPQNDNSTVSRILVGNAELQDANTKTITDAVTNRVTWAAGDEIALFNVNGTGRNDYKRFRIVSGVGNESAYFEAVTEDDNLTAGATYKVIYPYASVASYTDVSNRTSLAVYEIPNNVNNLATYDWLYSAPRTINADGTTPEFLMQHCMALIKFTLDVEGIIENDDFDEYLKNITVRPLGTSSMFAQRIYWNNTLDFSISSYGTNSVSFEPSSVYLENGRYTFWLPIYQDASLGIRPLILTVFASHGAAGNTLWSAATTFTPASILTPGYIYHKHLNFTVDGSERSGTLTIID